MFKKCLSLMLCAVLTASAVFSVPLKASAENVDYTDLHAVKGVYYNYYGYIFGPHVYNDDLFNKDARKFDLQMAVMSLNLAQASLDTSFEGSESYSILKEFMTDNGFEKFEVNQDYKDRNPNYVTTAVACAQKKIKEGNKTYTLVAIVPRSASLANEWPTATTLNRKDANGNIRPGDGADHAGYSECKDKVLEFAGKYIKDQNISGDIKVWTVGFSRGAGTVNLLGADLATRPNLALNNGKINLESKDLFCYTFGTPRAAAIQDLNKDGKTDCRDSKYDCIHNVYDDGDIMANFPFTSASFDRYGQDYHYSDRKAADYQEKKEKMKAYLSQYYMMDYWSMESGTDPDNYKPYKINAEALLNEGQLVFEEDTDSYLPKDRGDYIESIIETMARVEAEGVAGNNLTLGEKARKGYAKTYQEALNDFIPTMVYYGLSTDILTSSDYAIPMALCMYATVLIDQYKNKKSENVADALETVFNQIAAVVENGNGKISSIYDSDTAFKNPYLDMRDKYFEKDKEGIYRLKASVKNTIGKNDIVVNALLETAKELTAEMYRHVITDFLTDKATQEEIDRLTDPAKSKATAYLLAHILLNNVNQDLTSILKDLMNVDSQEELVATIINNEQFKALATIVNNYQNLSMAHYSELMNSWMRIDDPYYEVYQRPGSGQMTGYRRVFISPSKGVNVSGSVTNQNGNTVATFKNGELLSSTDQWIRITTCDSGNWLRIPINSEYTVTFTNDKACTYAIRVEEYAIMMLGVVRTDRGGEGDPWDNYSAKAGTTLTLKLPKLERSGWYYVMPSEVKYTLSNGGSAAVAQPDNSQNANQSANNAATVSTAEVRSASVPAAKSVKTKAQKKAFTIKWKKLSKKQRKTFSGVEVQYSTNPGFSSGTATRVLSNGKKSLKIKGLAKGRVYYVRVRNIKNSGGKKYVSGWSGVKRVKVK